MKLSFIGIFLFIFLTFNDIFSQNNIVEQKQKLLNYLKYLPSQDSNRIIAGQQCGHSQEVPDYYNKMINGLYNKTGKWVALMGADYGYIPNPDYGKANTKLIELTCFH